jgi:hypothetical protein
MEVRRLSKSNVKRIVNDIRSLKPEEIEYDDFEEISDTLLEKLKEKST